MEPASVTPHSGAVAGRRFVITGTLSASRSVVRQWIEAAGGVVTGSVAGATDYLVAGANTGNTKLVAARRHEVEVIDEASLKDLLAGNR